MDKRKQPWTCEHPSAARVACLFLALLGAGVLFWIWDAGWFGGPLGWLIAGVLLELVGVMTWLVAHDPRDARWNLVIQSMVCGFQAGAVAAGVGLVPLVLVVVLARSVAPLMLLVFLAPLAIVVALNAAFVARMRGIDWKAAATGGESS